MARSRVRLCEETPKRLVRSLSKDPAPQLVPPAPPQRLQRSRRASSTLLGYFQRHCRMTAPLQSRIAMNAPIATPKLSHNVTRISHLDLPGAGQVYVQG